MTPDRQVEVLDGRNLALHGGAPESSTWETVFNTGNTLLVRERLERSAATGWHSHGERDTFGVVLDGRLSIEYGPDHAVAVEEGEFFYVPAGLVHREIAGEATEAAVMLSGDGPPRVCATAPTSPPETAPQVAGDDDLVPTKKLENLVRRQPFPDAPIQQVHGYTGGAMTSEWHHHGENEVFGHVLRGRGYVDLLEGDPEETLATAGDFFHIPPGITHRDVNPVDEEQEYLLWIVGSGPRVIRADPTQTVQ